MKWASSHMNRKRNSNLGPPDPGLYLQAAFDERAYQQRRAYEEYLRATYNLRSGWNRPKLRIGDGRFTVAIARIHEGVAEPSFQKLHKEIEDLTLRGKSRITTDDHYDLYLITISFSSVVLATGLTSGTIKFNFLDLQIVLEHLLRR
jgi:hypothetical protein